MSEYFCYYVTDCWGCHKMESHGYNTEKEYQEQHADMAARGWRRKAFHPPDWDKGPWFCSEDCAENSYNALRAKAYWEEKRQEEFQKYCKETIIPTKYLIAFTVAIMVLVTGSIFYAR